MLQLNRHNIERDTLGLTALGNRFVGSEGERLARNFIAGRFHAVGLSDIRCEAFPVATYRPRQAACALIGPDGQELLRSVGLQFTGTGSVVAEAIDLGRLDTMADLAERVPDSEILRGRIAIMDTSYPYLFADELVTHHSAGLVIAGNAPEGYCRHLNAMMYPALAELPNGAHHPLPGVTVEMHDAERLRAHAAHPGARVCLTHAADYPIVETANVIGTLGGDGASGQIVVGAHYDTQFEGVGASDNAVGIACLIELARALKAIEPALVRRVVVVAFADEEAGFRGSVDYVLRHADEISGTVGMVNIDAPALGTAGRSLHCDPSAQQYALEAAASVGWSPDEVVDASLFPGSDHNPFIDAGVPAMFFWRHPPTHPYYHTSGDTVERMDFDAAVETAGVAAAAVLGLAVDPARDLGRARPTRRWIDLRPEKSSVRPIAG